MKKQLTIRMRARSLADWLQLANTMEDLRATGMKVNTKHRSDGTICLSFAAGFDESVIYEAVLDLVAFLEQQRPNSFEISIKPIESRPTTNETTVEGHPEQRNGRQKSESDVSSPIGGLERFVGRPQ